MMACCLFVDITFGSLSLIPFFILRLVHYLPFPFTKIFSFAFILPINTCITFLNCFLGFFLAVSFILLFLFLNVSDLVVCSLILVQCQMKSLCELFAKSRYFNYFN